MAKMTKELIEALYSNGIQVYSGGQILDDAVDEVLKEFPTKISKSSARFYIDLVGKYIQGRPQTWNQNSELVLYYVEHIFIDQGKDLGKNAFNAGIGFAKSKNRVTLVSKLNSLWTNLSGQDAIDMAGTNDNKEAATVNQAWWPSIEDYAPGLSKDDWLKLLNDGKTFTANALRAFAAQYDFGGVASSKQLELCYGGTSDFYRSAMMMLASKVKSKLGLTVDLGDNNASVWPIAFQGRPAARDEPGNYIWKIRPELYQALSEFDILRFLVHENSPVEEPIVTMTTKDTIHHIASYIKSKGFSFSDELIKNYYLSLKSKPFVILAGISGTGKTKLVELFADAIGASYHLVPVRPDWSDGSDLFGHNDLNGVFHPGPICEGFDIALNDRNKPVFVCLDEMNLARVEYYLSDFLSVIESRKRTEDGSITTIKIDQYEGGIPDNLYIVGTVNMDETTFPFSKKVLDRANTIEFNQVSLAPDFEATDVAAEALSVKNDFLRAEYLTLTKDCADESALVIAICDELEKINKILAKANAHVGYRVRDEICFYIINNKKAELLSRDEALDNEILQKILPRLQGSTSAVQGMLRELFIFCAGVLDSSNDSDSQKMLRVLNSDHLCKYRRSAEKIQMMMRRFEEDGFTAYWM